jgi:pimeloyl-ACP methyl ester carboxylesterase
MIEFISNIIDEVSKNISRFINKGKSNFGKDFTQINKRLKEYDTIRLFEKIISPTYLDYENTAYISLVDPINQIITKKFQCDSLYEPFDTFKNQYKIYTELHKIKGEHIISNHKKNSRALIFLHGFYDRSFELYKIMMSRKLVNEIGYDLFLIELPHHMSRQVKSSPFSGAYFFSGDPVITIEAFRQSVSEATQLFNTIKNDYKEVVLMGVSLGGLVTMYTTVVEDGLDKYIMIQAGANVNEYIGNLGLSEFFEENSKQNNIENDYDFAKMYKSLNYMKYRPMVDASKVVICGGKYDKIIPFWTVKKLEEKFRGAKTIFYDGGNFSINFIYSIIIEQALSKSLKRRNN